MSIYIISDLHLKQNDPEVFNQFKQFLKQISNNKNTLYILGDFFEYWVGDDVEDLFSQSVIALLKSATEHGLSVYFMHGNRDFLIGEIFAHKCGIQLIDDPFYLHWKNQSICLMHGDLLCTDDTSYLHYRKIVQSSWFKWFFLNLPLRLRNKMANKMRIKSKNRNRYEINFDATEKGINHYARECPIIIHGHTHKLAIHKHANKLRYVLGDWHKDQYSYIQINDHITLYNSGVMQNA
ncbi:MAG: UDP-2,3-diacylglucosamine diphosphatase [Gammaproteobacteria bacterium]|nr:MAG: UDP-2,3-diacylglucosamine diphosphatase [Gammaproteobacteria bacterium]UTW42149.1 UDP-2,3-diacylglucosamine diphosphatase [bacterium SCSIO 12844]